MNVSLTPQLDNFVGDQVQSGRYRSASEVVREGLRLLEIRQAETEFIQNSLDEGIKSPVVGGKESMERIRAKLALTHGV